MINWIKKISLSVIIAILLFISIVIIKLSFIGKDVNTEACKPYLLAPSHKKNVQLTYLGTSCFLIEYKGKQFMSDPYFSNPSLWSSLTGNMQQQALNTLINDSLFSNVSMTTVSHGHYDHCFDLQQILQPSTSIVADASVFNQMETTLKHQANRYALNFEPKTDWLYSYDSVFRVFPVLCKHGPHFGKTVLFSGNYAEPIAHLPATLWQWKLGTGNYSYLVDVLNGDSIVFRMALLYGDISAAEYAKIKSIYSTQKCDVMSSVFWKKKLNEPQLKLAKENTNADVIVLNHWNNFFRNNQKSLQQLRSAQLEKELKEFNDEKMPVRIMLPFTTVAL